MALQPTNAGIEYQQRVSANWLLLTLLNEDINLCFGFAKGTVELLKFETGSGIDDLVVLNSYGEWYYMQMKRKISYSNKVNSDFYKVVEQFIEQYEKNIKACEKYILITSSRSPIKITDRMLRLFDGIRITNSISKTMLSLNKEDRELLKSLTDMIKDIFFKRGIKSYDLTSFFKKLYIQKMDIESGQSDERLVILILASKKVVSPKLLWSALISQALEFGSNRRTVSSNYLKEQFKAYLNCEEKNMEISKIIKFSDENIIVNRDIYYVASEELVEILNSDDSYDVQGLSLNTKFVLELIRFKETEKNDYQVVADDTLILRSGIFLKVLHRTATYKEMQEWIEKNINVDLRSSTVVLNGNFDGIEEQYPLAVLHREMLINELANLKLECIHCGKPIFSESKTIEIDNTSEKFKIGLVHQHCLRPIDRVFGSIKSDIFNEYSFLKNFDFCTWLDQAKIGGQRLFIELQESGFNQVTVMWNRNSKNDRKGDYCLVEYLEDGSVNYQKRRGRIIRGSYGSLERISSKFNNDLIEAKKRGQRFGYLNKSRKFGEYQSMKLLIEVGEKFIECERTEVKKYDSLIRELDDAKGDYYAPLVYVSVDNHPVVVGNMLFLMTNPLKLNLFLENLFDVFEVDIISEDYSVEIIDSDLAFDILMQEIIESNLVAIVDPYFDNEGDLLRGIVIEECI